MTARALPGPRPRRAAPAHREHRTPGPGCGTGPGRAWTRRPPRHAPAGIGSGTGRAPTMRNPPRRHRRLPDRLDATGRWCTTSRPPRSSTRRPHLPRPADPGRAGALPTRQVVHGRHGLRAPAARGGRRRGAAALLILHPQPRHAPPPPGASLLAGRARQACARARPAGWRRRGRVAQPVRPRSHLPAHGQRGRGRWGPRLRPPPDHGPDGRRVAARPRRVEHARRSGEPQRPGQDRPKDRSAGLIPSP